MDGPVPIASRTATPGSEIGAGTASRMTFSAANPMLAAGGGAAGRRRPALAGEEDGEEESSRRRTVSMPD